MAVIALDFYSVASCPSTKRLDTPGVRPERKAPREKEKRTPKKKKRRPFSVHQKVRRKVDVLYRFPCIASEAY
jgi:hypothetical protein